MRAQATSIHVEIALVADLIIITISIIIIIIIFIIIIIVITTTIIDNRGSARVQNAQVLLKFLQEWQQEVMPKSRGQKKKDVVAKSTEIAQIHQKPTTHERMATQLLKMTEEPASGAQVIENFLSIKKKYSVKYPRRCRRHVCGAGAQSASTRLRTLTLPHSDDFDIYNTMFQLLEQIAQILQIDFPHKAALFEAIKKSSRDRDDILPALSSDVTEAKHLLIAFANGKALTEEPHVFLLIG